MYYSRAFPNGKAVRGGDSLHLIFASLPIDITKIAND